MPERAQTQWLFGPLPDLFFGAGLLYLVAMGALALAGILPREHLPFGVLPFLILTFSSAHYGATLLRVYEHEGERRTYRMFTLYATLLVIVVLIGALHSPLAGSLMITLYFTWSPWHYTGQNYGIGVMFLRRRGVTIAPTAKRWLYASFVLSYVAVFLNIHFQGGVMQGDPLGYSSDALAGFRFVSLGLPGAIRSLLLPVVGVCYVVSVAMAGFLLLRASNLRAIAPTAVLVLTQAAWFGIPHLAFYFDLETRIPSLNLATGGYTAFFVWAALGHAIQYLWITAYYARSDPRWTGLPRYFTKAFVFGNAVWAAPVFFFGPDLIGQPDYDGGLSLCVAAGVNLHHFILDGAIWKLRNPKIAAVLLRNQEEAGAAAAASAPNPWPRRLAWGFAAIFCIAKLLPEVEIGKRFPDALAARDLPGAQAILDRAALYGRDSGEMRLALGNQLVAERKPLEAIPNYLRSMELRPQAEGFARLGTLSDRQQGSEQALAVWRSGIEEFPDDFDLNRLLGMKLLKLERADEAVPYLERAVAIRPENDALASILERARDRRERAGG